MPSQPSEQQDLTEPQTFLGGVAHSLARCAKKGLRYRVARPEIPSHPHPESEAMTPCKHGWDDIRKCVVCTPQGGDLPPDVEKLIRAARLEALEEALKIVRENDPDIVDIEKMIRELMKK